MTRAELRRADRRRRRQLVAVALAVAVLLAALVTAYLAVRQPARPTTHPAATAGAR